MSETDEDTRAETPETVDTAENQPMHTPEAIVDPTEAETPEELERKNHPKYYDRNDWTFCGGILNPYEAINGEGSWGQEEAKVLQSAKALIGSEISNQDSTLIDAGCGMGRLSFEFAPMVGKVIAVEPDNRRMQDAVTSSIEQGMTDKIEFQNETIQNMEAEGANVAICSHIIQHVPLDSIEPIIAKLSASLNDNGILVLSTNNSGRPDDKFTKLYWDEPNQQNREEEISEQEFSDLQHNDQGILPIHWFSENSLQDLLTKTGFEIVDRQCYHRFPEDPEGEGRDVQIIARKITQEQSMAA